MPDDPRDPQEHVRAGLALAQQAIAQSVVLAMQNAVAAQQMMNTLTVAIAAQVAGEKVEGSDATLRAALDLLRSHDPVAQMKQLAELVREMQRAMEPPPPS